MNVEKLSNVTWLQWLMPISLATWKAETGRIPVPRPTRQKKSLPPQQKKMGVVAKA
jgi:hypothetical protein